MNGKNLIVDMTRSFCLLVRIYSELGMPLLKFRIYTLICQCTNISILMLSYNYLIPYLYQQYFCLMLQENQPPQYITLFLHCRHICLAKCLRHWCLTGTRNLRFSEVTIILDHTRSMIVSTVMTTTTTLVIQTMAKIRYGRSSVAAKNTHILVVAELDGAQRKQVSAGHCIFTHTRLRNHATFG